MNVNLPAVDLGKVQASTKYTVECFDKSGKLKWREEVFNIVVTEGLNNLLDTCLGGTVDETAWYVGLIDNSGFTALAAADTLASHGGWTEFTNYTGNRQTWTKNGVASGGAMSNSSAKAAFPILGTATLNGAFLCSVNTGTAGKLYGEASFSATRAVENGDTLNVQVDPSITSS
jgi:hypothetical protein